MFAFATLLLSYEFYSNGLHVANREWFRTYQRDMESHIIGRLVKSRRDGIFSAGGLTGLDSPDGYPTSYEDEPFEYQYRAYAGHTGLGPFTPYRSQIGGQGMLFGLLDITIPGQASVKLKIFHVLTATLSGIALALIVMWFELEFGWCVAAFVLGSLVFSQWLIAFGRNLWWSLWAFYVPMIAVAYFLHRHSRSEMPSQKAFGILVFITAFSKCVINGYEYITTTLIMMMVPYVYYVVRDRWTVPRALRGALIAIGSSCAAILLSLTILCVQIRSAGDTLRHGVDHIVRSLELRTYSTPHHFQGGDDRISRTYRRSLKADPLAVVTKYLDGTFVDFRGGSPAVRSSASPPWVSPRYVHLIVMFLLASVFVLFASARSPTMDRRRTLALVVATWASIASPLSWFIIFKAHSYVHFHINPVVWQMPFTLFGFALCGMAVALLLRGYAPDLKVWPTTATAHQT